MKTNSSFKEKQKNIRVSNLNALCEKYGRKTIAEKCGYSDTIYINQLCRGIGSFGNNTATKIERALELPDGYLSTDHKSSLESNVIPIKSQIEGGGVVFRKWQAQFGQGTGVPAEMSHDEIIGNLEVTSEWAEKYLSKATSYKNVELVTGLGDSMEPTYFDGETLFIDTGHSEFKLDSVYAFCLHGDFYIKRIQRRKGKIIAISDNKKYDEWEICPEDFEHLHVYGRIIKGARIFDI